MTRWNCQVCEQCMSYGNPCAGCQAGGICDGQVATCTCHETDDLHRDSLDDWEDDSADCAREDAADAERDDSLTGDR